MTIPRLFLVLLACGLSILAVAYAPDPDLWWHLRTGELILRDGLPRQDTFSFTVTGREWITHEWLTQVFMWGAYRAGGFAALNLAFTAVMALAFWLVYLRCDGRPYLAFFVTLLAAFATSPLGGPRPQVLNGLFLAAFIFVIEGYKNRRAAARGASDGAKDQRVLWLLPLLAALWANFHSGYMLGVVLLATYTAGEAAQLLLGQRDERGLDRTGVRWLAVMTVACFAAAVLNPSGYKLWTYPFETLGMGPVTRGWIDEWRSPNFHEIAAWPFAALMALGVASWAFSKKRPAWTDLLLFMGTAAGALVSARHISIFAITSAPIITRNLMRGLEGSRFHDEVRGEAPAPTRTRMVLYWVLAVSIVALTAATLRGATRYFGGAIGDIYPQAAVDFLEREGLASQRGYNDYRWGGYLIWRGVPVFVDGRADVYGDEFLSYYVKTVSVQEEWRKPLDDYGVQYVLVDRSTPLDTLLAASKEWREAYRDGVAAIFVRATSAAP
jgi:hypothetical protein